MDEAENIIPSVDNTPGLETDVKKDSRDTCVKGALVYVVRIEKHRQEMGSEVTSLDIISKAQPFKGNARNWKSKETQGKVNFY